MWLAVLILLASAGIVYKTKADYNLNVPEQSNARAYLVEVISPNGQILSNEGLSGANKLNQIVNDLEINLNPEDKVSIFPDLYLQMGGKITVRRAPIINLTDGKKKTLYRSWAGTVADLLAEKNIELGKDDKINPALDTAVSDGMDIKINRVAKTTVIDKKVIDFQIIKKSDPTVEKGNNRVETAGVKGSKDLTFEVTRIDGEEVSRRLISTNITQQPVNEVLVIGTKVVIYGSGVASIWKSSGDMVAACNFVSRGTKITVRNLNNGKSVNVTCMGGGLRDDRLVDMSSAAFSAIGGNWIQGLLNNVRAEKYYPE